VRVRRRRGARCAWLALFVLACSTAPLTVEEERQLGVEVEKQARQQFTFVRDEVVVGYVAGLGADLLRVMGPQPFDYDFYVLDDDELNAFATPGGNIYVHTGLILKARNVSELIGVMGHEVGHVYHRHVAENYRRQRNTAIAQQLGVLGVGVLAGGAAAQAANLVTGLGAMAYINQFGREAEREADSFAVEVVPKTGYDPSGLVTFFNTLIQEYGDRGDSFLSSHPATKERIANTQALIRAEHLPRNLRQDDDGKLEIVQHRIRLLTGKTPKRR
jgi:beta-barrel assembly-enhancing protease